MTTNGVLAALVSFSGANGALPYAPLLLASDGNFYGTTFEGGDFNLGTVFRLTPGGTLTTLVSFNGPNGAYPVAALIQGADGNLYGTTSAGGPNGYGTVFELVFNPSLPAPGMALGASFQSPAPASDPNLVTLLAFSGLDGANPQGGLVQGSDGQLYGTTSEQGPGGGGTIFRVATDPRIITPPARQEVVAGSTVTFMVVAAGTSPLRYQWFKDATTPLTDGGTISGSSSATLTLSHVQGSDAGSYSILVSHTVGSVQSAAATLTVVPAPVIPDLVGYWPFDEGSGTTAYDASGHGHDATLFNGVSWASGKLGGAALADGLSGYIFIPPIDLSGTRAVSLALWVNRLYSTPDTHVLLENSPNYNFSSTGFALCPEDDICSGAVKVGVRGGVSYNVNCYSPPSSGLWHHLVAIFDKSQPAGSELTFYLDGVLQSPLQRYLAADNSNAFGHDPIYLFSRAGSSLFCAGLMDDLRLYDRALQPAEVQQLYTFSYPAAVQPLSAPVITSFKRLPPGQLLLEFSATPGLSYTVLSSASPTNWMVLGPATETSPGQFQFLDADRTNQQQFYRIRCP